MICLQINSDAKWYRTQGKAFFRAKKKYCLLDVQCVDKSVCGMGVFDLEGTRLAYGEYYRVFFVRGVLKGTPTSSARATA